MLKNEIDGLTKAGAIVGMITAITSALLILSVSFFFYNLGEIFEEIPYLIWFFVFILAITLLFAIPSFIFNYLLYKKGYRYRVLAIIFGFLGSSYIGPILIIISMASNKQQTILEPQEE